MSQEQKEKCEFYRKTFSFFSQDKSFDAQERAEFFTDKFFPEA